jgi:hypothetical protein
MVCGLVFLLWNQTGSSHNILLGYRGKEAFRESAKCGTGGNGRPRDGVVRDTSGMTVARFLLRKGIDRDEKS